MLGAPHLCHLWRTPTRARAHGGACQFSAGRLSLAPTAPVSCAAL